MEGENVIDQIDKVWQSKSTKLAWTKSITILSSLHCFEKKLDVNLVIVVLVGWSDPNFSLS